MKDLEKQVTEDRKDALPPVQVMTVGEEQDPLILVDRRMNLVSIAQHYYLRAVWIPLFLEELKYT
jgi:hypothetical protein